MAGRIDPESLQERGLESVFRDLLNPGNERVRLRRQSFREFVLDVVRDPKGRPLVLQPFHEQVIEALEHKRVCLLEMFRGSGKSTLAEAYAAWRIGNDRDIRIVVASKSASLAEERLRGIERLMLTREYIEAFGELVPPPKSGHWTAAEKIVRGRSSHATHLTLFAIGMGGQVIGRRADIIIADDIIDNKVAQSPAANRQSQDWFWKELLPVLEPGGQLIVLFTPWASDDVYADIKAFYRDDADAVHIRVPALSEGRSVWPERFPLERLLEEQRKKPLQFASQYLCEPVDTSASMLRPEWLRLADELPPIDELDVCFGVDPAWSAKTSADYFAVAIGGLHQPTRRAYLLEIVRTQASPSEAVTLLQSLAQRWRPRLIVMEDNAAQSYLRELMERETFLPIQGSRSRAPKLERWKAMALHFTAGRVLLAAERDETGSLVPVPSLEEFVYEWVKAPHGEHDDCLDAVEKLLEAIVYGPEPVDVGVEPSPRPLPQEGERCFLCEAAPAETELMGYRLCRACRSQAMSSRPSPSPVRQLMRRYFGLP